MEDQFSTCAVCGQTSAVVAGSTGCAYCLLELGLRRSNLGVRSQVLSEQELPASADEFLRQGVLPQFGDYQLEAEIARGGMGVVYRARQASLNRTVAIKMILAGQLATPDSVQRFRREAEAAAQLHHPGIVQIYEIGDHEMQHYFSMELIDGDSLAECLKDFQFTDTGSAWDRRHQAEAIASIVARVARALDFAHQRGVLHRDLKPSNILVDEQGQPHLTDFGLAKLTGREQSGLTLSSTVLGTPGYLAPEMVTGGVEQATTAVDIYGLGATLYELLTGRPPFVGSHAFETMLMATREVPVSPRSLNSAIPRDLETITLRCLEKSPRERYHSAEAVAEELERFLRREPIRARPVSLLEQIWRWQQRNPMLAAMIFALVFAILSGTGAALWQWQRAEQANVTLTENVAHLEWNAIDAMVQRGESAPAIAKVASLLRADPADWKAAMFAMSVMEQRQFPVPEAPPIRHPSGAELSVARLSPDGTRIATASFDGTARIWDATTSVETTPPLAHEGPVTWLAFHPEGKLLATCSGRSVRLWDAASGQTVGGAQEVPEAVNSIEFSSNGRYLLWRTANSVGICDGEDGRMLLGPLRHEGQTAAARFVLDASAFFSVWKAGEKSVVKVWDLPTGLLRASLNPGPLSDADLSNDLTRIAVLEAGGQTAWVGDFPEARERKQLAVDNGRIGRVLFGNGNQRLAVIGLNHWVRVYDAPTGLPTTPELPHYFLVEGASFFEQDERLLTWGLDSLLQVWDVPAGKATCEPMRHPQRVTAAETGMQAGRRVFLATQSHLKSRNTDTRTGLAQLWRVQDGGNPLDRTFGNDPNYHDGGAISPDGRLLAISKTTSEIFIYDRATGQLVQGPLKIKGGAWGLLFTLDSQRLISTTSRGQVSVWSVQDGKPVAQPVEIATTFQPCELSPDGEVFGTGSTDQYVRLWGANSGQLVWEQKHGSEINSIHFSPDGRLLASAGEDRIVRIWSVKDGAPVRDLAGHRNEVMSVFFSPDGRRLVSASLDFTACIWDVTTGKTLAALPHQGEVIDANFSPDGRFVATASRDRTAVLWNAETGQPASHSLLHEQGVRNVAFSPDSKFLFTIDFRGLRVWDVATAHPLTIHLPNLLAGGTGYQTTAGQFNVAPDASAVLVAGDCYEAKLWNLSIPQTDAPIWFPEFLEAVVGQRFNLDRDRAEPVPVDRFLEMQDRLQNSSETDDYTLWARRWLGIVDTSSQ